MILLPLSMKESLDKDLSELCRYPETFDLVGRKELKRFGNVPTIYGVPIFCDPRVNKILIRADRIPDEPTTEPDFTKVI